MVQLLHMHFHDFVGIVLRERPSAGEQFEGGQSQGVDIAALVHRQAFDLLRGHVKGGSGQHVFGPAGAGQAKVENLETPVGGDKEVAGFDVLVNDAPRVGIMQAGTDLQQVVHHLIERQGPAIVDNFPQGAALDVFHHDEHGLVPRLDVVDLDNVIVVELGNGDGFLLEVAHKFIVHGHVVKKHLDGHRHVQAGVQPLVDDAVSAAADDVGHEVFADLAHGCHAAGGEALGHDLRQEIAQLGVIVGDGVEILLAHFPHVHLGFGIDVGAARLPGEQRHFTDNVALPPDGDPVGVPVFFDQDGAGAGLDNEEGVAFIPLGDQAVSRLQAAVHQGIEHRADRVPVEALETVDRAEKGKFRGGGMAFGPEPLLRRPMQRDLAAERETRKMKPGIGGRLRAPLDLGQIKTPGAFGRAPDFEDAPRAGLIGLGVDGGGPAQGLVGDVHETLTIIVGVQGLSRVFAQWVKDGQVGLSQEFSFPASAIISIDHRCQPPRNDAPVFM